MEKSAVNILVASVAFWKKGFSLANSKLQSKTIQLRKFQEGVGTLIVSQATHPLLIALHVKLSQGVAINPVQSKKRFKQNSLNRVYWYTLYCLVLFSKKQHTAQEIANLTTGCSYWSCLCYVTRDA